MERIVVSEIEFINKLKNKFRQCQRDECKEEDLGEEAPIVMVKVCAKTEFHFYKKVYQYAPDKCNQSIAHVDCVIINQVSKDKRAISEFENFCIWVIELKSSSGLTEPDHIISKFENSYSELRDTINDELIYHFELPVLFISPNFERLSQLKRVLRGKDVQTSISHRWPIQIQTYDPGTVSYVDPNKSSKYRKSEYID